MNQNNQDIEHLRLLSIFHYVLAAIAGLFSCFPFIHVGMGIAMLTGVFDGDSAQAPPPAFVGWMFVGIGSFFILLGWIYTLCLIAAGRKISKRKSYLFCLIVAGISCVFVPFGTVLGVFTIIVLSRPSVKPLFCDSGIQESYS